VPEILVKIINEDGTEQTFGPMTVPKAVAGRVAAELEGPEGKRLEQVEAARVVDIEAESTARSNGAAAHNRRREERGQQGLDPDGDDQ